MTANRLKIAGETLKKILATEMELLRSGRASDAASLTEDKLSAMRVIDTIIGTSGLDSVSETELHEIESIIHMAKRNASHFEAVRNGVGDAISRLQNLNGNAYVGAYRPDGGKVSFTESTGLYMTKS